MHQSSTEENQAGNTKKKKKKNPEENPTPASKESPASHGGTQTL